MTVADRVRVERAEAITAATGVALLGGSWIAAAPGTVSGWETHVFRWINDLPDAVWTVVRVPMQLGSFGGALVVVVVTGLATRDRRLTLATLGASQAAYWGAKVVKNIVARGRPALLLPGVHLHESAGGFGYLSGHTAVAVALTTALFPSLATAPRIVAVFLAATVAFARIDAGAHLPLDVVGGAGLGLVCGVVARRVFAVAYSSPRRRS